MKTTVIRLLFGLLTLSISVGCSHNGQNEPKEEIVLMHSFVRTYYDFNDITIEFTYGNRYLEEPNGPLSINGINIFAGEPTKKYSYNSKGEDKERYDALCEKHGDISYNREVNVRDNSFPAGFSAVDFTSISIVSDADWRPTFNNQNLAGSELAELFVYKTWSPHSYIKDEYSGLEIQLDHNMGTNIGLSLLGSGENRKLMEITFLGIPLIFTGTYPIEPQIHNITITLTADDGRVFKKTIEAVWEL